MCDIKISTTEKNKKTDLLSDRQKQGQRQIYIYMYLWKAYTYSPVNRTRSPQAFHQFNYRTSWIQYWESERGRERERGGGTDRQTERCGYRQPERVAQIETERQTQGERETNRWTDIDRQTNRREEETDRQRAIERNTKQINEPINKHWFKTKNTSNNL